MAVDLRPLLDGADPADPVAVTEVVNRRIFGGTLPPEVVAACRRVAASGGLQAAFRVIGVALASPAFQVR